MFFCIPWISSCCVNWWLCSLLAAHESQWNCNLLTNWLTLTVRRECLCLGVIKAFFCRYALVQNTFEVESNSPFSESLSLSHVFFLLFSCALSRDLYCSLLISSLFIFDLHSNSFALSITLNRFINSFADVLCRWFFLLSFFVIV